MTYNEEEVELDATLTHNGRSKSKLGFLFESAATTETIGRYSFVGTGQSANTGESRHGLPQRRPSESDQDRPWPW
jgi:hypothetical protein